LKRATADILQRTPAAPAPGAAGALRHNAGPWLLQTFSR
jgi:hypothetical protein